MNKMIEKVKIDQRDIQLDVFALKTQYSDFGTECETLRVHSATKLESV